MDQAEAWRFSLSANLPQQKPGRAYSLDSGENPIAFIGVLRCGLSASILFAIVTRLVNREMPLADEPPTPKFGHRPQSGMATIQITSGVPEPPITYGQLRLACRLHSLMRRVLKSLTSGDHKIQTV